MARCLLLMVCVAFVVVWLSAIQGVNSNCANHCRERCDEVRSRQNLPRVPCYKRCRKLAATCESCSGPRWCFKCSPGYLLTTEPRCVFNKCRKNNGDCDADATCSKSMNRYGGISFTCECNTGYSGDGRSCTDVDECQTNNGGCSDNGDTNAICSNSIGSFTCSCSEGFIGQGTSCIDINECSVNRGGCRDNGDTKAVCVNNPGSFTCNCSTGFTSAGTSCNDINECLTSNGVCRNNGETKAVCVNNPGSFTCTCSTGYSYNGTNCVDVNECEQQPAVCTAKGDDKATCKNEIGSFTCTCSSGFAGALCEGQPITRTSTITSLTEVRALASDSDYLYVARQNSNEVAVYSASTFNHIRDITVTGGSGLFSDMVVSPNKDYLFVSDFDLHKVFKVPLPSGTPSSWDVVNYPTGMAIDSQNNMLVTGSETIGIYNLDGAFDKSIAVENTLNSIRALSDGKWAVTLLGPKYGAAVLSNKGGVLYSYGSSVQGSTAGYMNTPFAMTVGSQGYLLVADAVTNLVLILDPTLSEARILSLPISDLDSPQCVWLDESRGILIVGEFGSSSRVLVFSNVYSLASAFAAAKPL